MYFKVFDLMPDYVYLHVCVCVGGVCLTILYIEGKVSL